MAANVSSRRNVGRCVFFFAFFVWSLFLKQNKKGLCHGWAPASLFYKQPNPVNLPNPDGVIVPFGSSDVKALLTYFVGNYEEAFSTSTYLGERCNYDLDQNPNLGSRPSCADLNAGSFFVQLVNQVSNLKQG
jgi:hypothetical protein